MIGKNEEWEELNRYLREYGSQRSEQHWQSEKKEEVSASGPAPHDDHQDKNVDDDDLQEQNRNLRGKLLAMEAAMKDAGKTTRAASTLRRYYYGDAAVDKGAEECSRSTGGGEFEDWRVGESCNSVFSS